MAEVLGVASGVAGLISLTIEVFDLSYRYITEVRGAAESVHRFLSELESLKGVLLKIKRLSTEIGNVEIFGDGTFSLLSADDSNNYLELLNTIRQELDDRLPNGSFRRKVKALTWPFSEERTNALVGSLHRHLDIYQMALAVDNLAISSLTLSEIRHSRKSQDAGTGKTVMTSIVVDYLTRIYGSHEVRVAYIYCDYKDQSVQTASNLIASLARQLVGHPDKLPTQLENLYKELEQHRRRPSLADLRRLLTTLCNERERTYVVVDALDECDAMHERRHLLPLLQSLPRGSTRLFVTSRPYSEDIRCVFLNAPQIPIEAPESDIQQFVQEQMADRSGFFERTTDTLRNQIMDTVCSRASGMFLFAVLQIDRICVARTIKKIKFALESMPNELNELYRQTVERIRSQPGEDGELGMKVLSWVTHAKRPLRVTEIQHALAVEVDEDGEQPCQMDFDNILSPQSLTDLCAGLVVTDPSSQVIRLVHYTTQEFFDRERQNLFEDAELDISRVCLTYLSFDVVLGLPTDKYLSIILSSYPFFEYAVLYWLSHLREIKDYDDHWQNLLREWDGETRPTLTDLCDDYHKSTFEKAVAYIDDVKKFLFSAVVLRSLILRPSAKDRITEAELLNRSHTLPLEAASECGLLSLTQFILTHSNFARGPSPGFALALKTAVLQASSAGHSAIVRLLLTDKHVSRLDTDFTASALNAACKNGHVAVAEILINFGADLNARDQWNWRPLHHAAYGGHSELVALLLREGAHRFYRTPFGLTACHMAAEHGNNDVVLLLLQGTNPSQWPSTMRKNTVLHSAAGADHVKLVSLLLTRGFDALAQNSLGKTAQELVSDTRSAEIEFVFAAYMKASFKRDEKTSSQQDTAEGSASNDSSESSSSYTDVFIAEADINSAIIAQNITGDHEVQATAVKPSASDDSREAPAYTFGPEVITVDSVWSRDTRETPAYTFGPDGEEEHKNPSAPPWVPKLMLITPSPPSSPVLDASDTS